MAKHGPGLPNGPPDGGHSEGGAGSAEAAEVLAALGDVVAEVERIEVVSAVIDDLAARLEAQDTLEAVLGQLERTQDARAAEQAFACAEQLRSLSGRTHSLHSAAVICEAGRAVWRHVEVAKMHVRTLSDAFIDSYLVAEWPAISGCVGCYRLEGRGAQLFLRVQGSHFTVLGLPLLPLLDYLRVREVLPS